MDKVFLRLNDRLNHFQTDSNILKNHLIFSFAFSKFSERYKTGTGKVYVADSCFQEYETIGYLTGIVYWFFYEGVYCMASRKP